MRLYAFCRAIELLVRQMFGNEMIVLISLHNALVFARNVKFDLKKRCETVNERSIDETHNNKNGAQIRG